MILGINRRNINAVILLEYWSCKSPINLIPRIPQPLPRKGSRSLASLVATECTESRGSIDTSIITKHYRRRARLWSTMMDVHTSYTKESMNFTHYLKLVNRSMQWSEICYYQIFKKSTNQQNIPEASYRTLPQLVTAQDGLQSFYVKNG